MACETIKMEITTNPDYVSIIRLTASGIANKMGFPIDDIVYVINKILSIGNIFKIIKRK